MLIYIFYLQLVLLLGGVSEMYSQDRGKVIEFEINATPEAAYKAWNSSRN